MKIAVVGGGSTYTPELVDGFARLGTMVTELVLIDPSAERLDIVGAFAARIFAQYGHPGKVTWTTDLDAGVTDADAAVIQLRVGGQRARISDESFPLECGCVGQETTGAGGLAKALRTVPVILDVAERIRARARPGAWIVDFTNPVGIVTRALLDAGHRAVGLCNVAIGFQRRFASYLEVPPGSVVLDHVGLNHLTWERAAFVDGVDRLPELLSRHLSDIAGQVDVPAEIISMLGSVPSYYLSYFYRHDGHVREALGAPTRGQRVAEIEATLLDMYRDVTLTEKPALLAERGGAFYSEAAVGLLASLFGLDDDAVHSVNVRNLGTLPFLPADAVIEVSARAGRTGPDPLPVTALPPDLAGLITHTWSYEELALDAALRGGRDRVYRALLAHPLIGQHERATALTDRLIAAGRDHLAWAR
ncbi:6-phospho-beta-glucosidase [Actinoplanes sp. SE50]|uniref:family 4 glycosyl hydrolase n=1 Tax=unclassified Actinoplanes TaxID=2626549 RepID=UPI00023EC422|nr:MULTISPECIES: 6-phospho-beta-glucosidase [unclassified Actinoplanes]AEV83052.1 6-phospho-beta-glucosidase [Actinoplanes sp. SE50/110]ATO81448.1 6-phospho-beta-glucosidase [Actinoplanes sp. SE50]SLL98855.1 6-phospho-beta-glucosidase [Actinoplanes sp. SE50/110]